MKNPITQQGGTALGSIIVLTICVPLATMAPRLLSETTPAQSTNSTPAEPPTVAIDVPTPVGFIRGRVIVDGEIPPPTKLTINKDVHAFKQPIFDPNLKIDADSRGLADVVIWIDRLHKWPASIARESETYEPRTLRLEIENGMYQRQITLARVGDRVEIFNLDPVGHNSHVQTFAAPAFGAIVHPREPYVHVVSHGERLPMPISCTIHPWMRSWIVMSEHPYMAVTDGDGNFAIEAVPPGEHQLTFWHQRAGYLQRGAVVVDDTLANDLGEIAVSIDELK